MKDASKNTSGPVFDNNKIVNRGADFNGRIVISRGMGRHQNSSKSFIIEDRNNTIQDGPYSGP